jgi:alkylated DNA nucleotide flippase Atl1
MTLASTRAQAVAEILWELKRAEKLATLTAIAERAGFSPGSGGRTTSTCLKTVRRDWPHLQWWRAVADDGILGTEQESHLVEAGFETEPADGDRVVLKSLTEHLMAWPEPDDAENESDSASGESV